MERFHAWQPDLYAADEHCSRTDTFVTLANRPMAFVERYSTAELLTELPVDLAD